jgi:hypothetical protein
LQNRIWIASKAAGTTPAAFFFRCGAAACGEFLAVSWSIGNEPGVESFWEQALKFSTGVD